MAKKILHKIALYIRVSTEEQAENPEGSIRSQEDRLRSAVKFRNQESAFGEITQVFIDRARSGKDTNRPELQRLLKSIKASEVTLLMVTELSRLSRSIRDFSDIWDLMKAHGCQFQSLRENFDTTTAAGEMVMYTMANLAQFERRQVVERVTANFVSRSSRGLYNGGRVPLGYKLIEDKKGYLAVDERSAEIVRDCFDVFLKEGTLSQACRSLNERRHKIERKVEGGGRNHRLGIFTIDALYQMLTNKSYIGIKAYVAKGEAKEVKAVWEPIVEEKVFIKVQARLTKNFRTKKPHSWRRHPYQLSGFIRCGSCNDALVGKSAHGNGGKVPYYEHGNRVKRQAGLTNKIFCCEPTRFSADKVEAFVWSKVEELLMNPKTALSVIKLAKTGAEKNTELSEIKKSRAKLAGFNTQTDSLAERLSELPKTVSATPIYKQMERIEELKRKEEEHLGLLESIGQSVHEKPATLKDYESLLYALKDLVKKGADPELKAEIIEALVHKIELFPDKVIVHYFTGKDQIALTPGPSGPGALFLSKSDPGRARSLNKVIAIGDWREKQAAGRKNLIGLGSNTLTNGDREQDRTADLEFRKLRFYPPGLFSSREIEFARRCRQQVPDGGLKFVLTYVWLKFIVEAVLREGRRYQSLVLQESSMKVARCFALIAKEIANIAFVR
jgi:site-specific DNA recombinase